MANLDSDSIIDVVTHVRACARTSVYSPVAACSVPSLNQRQSRAPRPFVLSESCLRSARLPLAHVLVLVLVPTPARYTLKLFVRRTEVSGIRPCRTLVRLAFWRLQFGHSFWCQTGFARLCNYSTARIVWSNTSSSRRRLRECGEACTAPESSEFRLRKVSLFPRSPTVSSVVAV